MPLIRQLDANGMPGLLPNDGAQRAFCENWTNFFVALAMGWGGGKTWAGANKLVTLHIHNAFDAFGEPTFVPSVVVAPTYRSAQEYDIPELIKALNACNISYSYRHGMTEGFVLHDLGTREQPSVIMIRTAERPDLITGWEVGASWGDEATRWPQDWLNPLRDSFVQLMGRVRHHKANFRQAMFTYTPEGDATRMYEEFETGRKDHVLYRGATNENPSAVSSGFFERQMDNLPPDLVKQYIQGQTINLKGGKVYNAFDVAKHVSTEVALQKDIPLDMMIDFNISPGMHILLGQHHDGDDRYWVTHEIYQHKLDLRGAIIEFAKLLDMTGGKFRYPEIQVFGDATGSSRWAATGETSYTILAQALDGLRLNFRFRVPRGNPLIVDRVNSLNVAMLDLKERVHWQVHPRCRTLIDDLKRMRWDEKGRLDETNPELGHSSAAEGYRIFYLRPARIHVPLPRGGQTGSMNMYQ